MHPSPTAARPLVPIGLRHMAASAFFFSTMGFVTKLLGQRVPAMEIVFARILVTFVLSFLALRRARVSPLGNDFRLLLARGVAGFTALSCYFFAVTRLPLADATVIQFTNPLLTAVLAALVLGERLDGRVAFGALLCALGIVLVARPSFLFGTGTHLPPVHVAVALTGAFFSAVAYVVIRRIGATEHPAAVVFSFPLVGLPLSLPFAFVGSWVVPSPRELVLLLAVGVLAQLGQVELTKGLRLEPAGRATSVTYVQIVLAYVWGLAFLGESPEASSLAGAFLVVSGTLVVALRPAR